MGLSDYGHQNLFTATHTQTFFDSSLRASDFHITFCLSAVLPFFLLWTTCGNITTLLTDTSSAQGDVRRGK